MIYAQLKYMWANHSYGEALIHLRSFTENLVQNLSVESAQPLTHKASKQKLETLSKLLARCYFKQGEWQYALKKSEWSDVGRCGINPLVLLLKSIIGRDS